MPHIEPLSFEPAKPQKPFTDKRHSPLIKFVIILFIALLAITTWFLFNTKSIRIIIEPDSADIIIHTPFKLALAERYLLRKDNYTIEINAKGYHTLSDTLQVGDKQNQDFTYVLTPLPGHLQVDVGEVTQATIFLDGIAQGLAPMTINDIDAGTHQIRIETERYFPYEQTIEIEGKDISQDLNLELVPAWADIEFVSSPEGAEIIVDDEDLMSTPATLALLQGKHNVRIKKSGFKDWQKVINVIASEAMAFTDIILKPADATLFISSKPVGANVTINGNYAGKTPLQVNVNPGKSSSIRLYKQGFIARTSSVTIAAGRSKRLNIKMPPELVDVAFNLQPTDSKLYINGKLTQLTGSTLSLPTTQQTIEIRKEGYVTYSTTITPHEGIAQQIKVTLKTIQQQKQENIKPLITSSAGQKLKLFYPHGFTMGASRREPGRRSNETIQNIELKRPFYLAVTEVTNDEFRLFKSGHNSGNIQGHSMNAPKQPVVNVSWQDAALYCNWLSQQDSLKSFYTVSDNKISGIDHSAPGYRLVTEAEWAWAARSISKTDLLKFPWGEQLPPTPKSGNYADNKAAGFLGKIINNYSDGYAVAAPVGSFAANHKGLYDIGGNVAEWVHDFYSVQASNAKSVIDPLGPAKGEFHVIRGASWAHGTITELRLSYRDYTDKPREDVGFRVARYLE